MADQVQVAELRDQLLHDAVALHQLGLGLFPVRVRFEDQGGGAGGVLGERHHARRQLVVPSGLSSRMIPAASSSARILSDSAKLRAFLASMRAAMACSI